VPDEVCLVFVTGPDRESLVRIGRALVDERLAACVNVLPEVTSIFRWEGDIDVTGEALAMLKTTRDRFGQVCRRVSELHPYDLPECIAVPVAAGSERYLSWVRQCVQEEGS
jgi:periplasmic divalent cation tolerance protein